MPILVLSLICLVISGALAFTNSVTVPVIESEATRRSEEIRNSIIPQAAGFELVEIDGLPATIKEVYKSTNNVGYIFIILTSGYGGDMKLICGIDPDGNVIHCSTLEQSETKGLGARITEEQFESQFDGKDNRLDGVSAITGATISSRTYINAVKDALAAFETIKEAGV